MLLDQIALTDSETSHFAEVVACNKDVPTVLRMLLCIVSLWEMSFLDFVRCNYTVWPMQKLASKQGALPGALGSSIS